VVAPNLPDTFSSAAAYGDLLAGVLAIITLIALQCRWAAMLPLAWVTSIVDLVNALSHISVVPYLHAGWYIPAFLVPLLIVTHVMTLSRLAAHIRSPIPTPTQD
jgi:hypothetical protein